MSKLYTTDCLNPYQRETGCNQPSSSEKHNLSTSEHPMDPKQVCTMDFFFVVQKKKTSTKFVHSCVRYAKLNNFKQNFKHCHKVLYRQSIIFPWTLCKFFIEESLPLNRAKLSKWCKTGSNRAKPGQTGSNGAEWGRMRPNGAKL